MTSEKNEKGCTVWVRGASGGSECSVVVSEPVSGTAKGEETVQVEFDGNPASVTVRVGDLEYISPTSVALKNEDLAKRIEELYRH